MTTQTKQTTLTEQEQNNAEELRNHYLNYGVVCCDVKTADKNKIELKGGLRK